MHGLTNESVDELSELLSDFLPLDSILPTKQGQCKKKIKRQCLGYENIHTCVNGCVLFHKNIASETEYPKCQEERYKPGLKSATVPRKVLRHFPLIL